MMASRCTRVSDKPLQCLRSNGASRYGITIRRPYALPDDIASRGIRRHAAFGCWPGNANAGHPDRHEKARSELTGAAGSHMSSAPRVRHCWLADIDLAAFVRHNHAMSWTAGDDTGRLYGPRDHPRDHGGAIDCGSRRTCFPTFYHNATLAD